MPLPEPLSLRVLMQLQEPLSLRVHIPLLVLLILLLALMEFPVAVLILHQDIHQLVLVEDPGEWTFKQSSHTCKITHNISNKLRHHRPIHHYHHRPIQHHHQIQ